MALPENFVARLAEIYPQDHKKILDIFDQERIGSLRINTLHPNPEKVLEEFEEKNISITTFEPIEGVYTFNKDQQYAIKGTKSFYEGKIYLQSLASMMPVLALDPQKHTKILDICAAPGGKTTQLAAITGNRSDIIALEKNKIRCDKLEYNCSLQGATRIKTHKIDALIYLKDKKTRNFDAIILDVPCSAEGRIQTKNEKTYGFWTLENIAKKSKLQTELLAAAVKKLTSGGTLVYSTCTLAPEENEVVVQDILEKFPDLSLEKISLWEAEYIHTGISDWNGEDFPDHEKMIRILPSHETEGFFIAKIVKKFKKNL